MATTSSCMGKRRTRYQGGGAGRWVRSGGKQHKCDRQRNGQSARVPSIFCVWGHYYYSSVLFEIMYDNECRHTVPLAAHGLVAGDPHESGDAVPTQHILGLGQGRLLRPVDQHCRGAK
jgi:hypothetical protein